ncbi:MAG: hypothetical protein HY221_00015 [Candidatus Sungbacteria bacterium]|uniref:Uncharacterized protein n=1 Tax=Candidatus Sungiibacteriota bacterium TaxID=2750080 RepID=A0A932VS23_9BACT|nr:hypothetical protein [Candidatus Sungbacteria bacterium]
MRFEWTCNKLPDIADAPMKELPTKVDAMYTFTLYRINEVALVQRKAIATLDFCIADDYLVWQGTSIALDTGEIDLDRFFQELSVAPLMDDFQDLKEILITPERYMELRRSDPLRIVEYQYMPEDDKSQADVYAGMYMPNPMRQEFDRKLLRVRRLLMDKLSS